MAVEITSLLQPPFFAHKLRSHKKKYNTSLFKKSKKVKAGFSLIKNLKKAPDSPSHKKRTQITNLLQCDTVTCITFTKEKMAVN